MDRTKREAGDRPARPIWPQDPRQNPHRWRQALGVTGLGNKPSPTAGLPARRSHLPFPGPSQSHVREGSSNLLPLPPPPTSLQRSTSPNPTQPNLQLDDREWDELVSKPGFSSEERYRILDARDKLIRKRNPKVRVRVEFAVTLAGTCFDMCPEKERYMRETQRRVSAYEFRPASDPAEIDHQLAIKEYSRSSADQEEPLPSDLRPIAALHLTLNYLLHNIVSRIEEEENENLGDWYFFIWDRTRSIRKDMTQQQLGDVEAVSLMEKCARFHIYCSTRLCELDRFAFDHKLNDENLMKCLQSLDHMYMDLALKGIKCPNEPEFRSYQILMYLNEGDIIWEIQQKPDWILKSEPVLHALKIYSALNALNCVAFFRLVQQSSFMASCILHRYFFQVRTVALRRFIKTYSLRDNITLPTAQIKKMLGYGAGEDNFFTFKHFCESHKVMVMENGTMTMGRRRDFDEPTSQIANREFALVESKLNVPVAEAINGGPLGPNPLPTYTPHSSFDENGYFKQELLEELKRTCKPNFTPTTTPIKNQAQSQSSNSTKSIFGSASQSKTGVPAGDLRTTRIHRGEANPFGGGVFQTSIPKTASVYSVPITSSSPPSPERFSFSRLGSISKTKEYSVSSSPFGVESTVTASPAISFSFAARPAQSVSVVSSASPGAFIFTSSNISQEKTVPAPSNVTDHPSFYFTPPTNQPETSVTTSSPFSKRIGQSPLEEIRKRKAEQQLSIVNEVADRVFRLLVNEVVLKEIKQIAIAVRVEELENAKKASIQRAFVLKTYSEVESSITAALIREVAQSCLKKTAALRAAAVEIEAEILNSVLDELVTQVALELYNRYLHEEQLRREHLQKIYERINLRMWFVTWKDKVEEIKWSRRLELERQRWNMDNFPPIMACQLSPTLILKDWSCFTSFPPKTHGNQLELEKLRDLSMSSQLEAGKEAHISPAVETESENMSEFPPILALPLSPASILQEWSGFTEESLNEGAVFKHVQHSISERQSIEKYLEESKTFPPHLHPVSNTSPTSRKRKRGFSLDETFYPIQKRKTENTGSDLLQSLQTMLKDIGKEKEILESSLSSLQSSTLN